jgi:putative oxidoreductase
VRVNARVQVGAGALLAAGVLERTAAAVLAASLIPTTLAGHAPWAATEPVTRSAETIQLAKNAGILAALLLLASGRRPQS